MLDRLTVETHRHVVHEDAAVDLAEVHHPLAPVDERVEGPDHVVAIDAEVEGKVIAGAGRDTRIGDAALGRDGGDGRLRPVTPGHRQGISPGVERLANERCEVRPGRELDRLDPTSAGLVDQVEP